MEARPEFELSIASQAKPLPLGPLAVATFINYKSDGKTPISIVSKPVSSFDEKQPASAVSLIRNKEYHSLHTRIPKAIDNVSSLVE